ncbi:MAG: lipoyl(octanoyl) transferase LipB [Gammaproteobacteria bacterium]|nr:lipoyl(octanoyl) transferase LipB [Gammaproteobacteria bacterium]
MEIIVRDRGLVPYLPLYREMQQFTAERHPATPDEIWLLQHPPIFTRGLNSKGHHLLNPGTIPVVAIDRGGDVTYHGPGQWIAYLLLDLRRCKMGVRQLVSILENSVIALLEDLGLSGAARKEAPGVYIASKKIASLGLRVRRQGCYHGMSLNCEMDLTPFSRINPCGQPGLQVTDLANEGVKNPLDAGRTLLLHHLLQQLSP